MKNLKLLVYEPISTGLKVLGMLQDYVSLSYSPVFNNIGDFVLTLPFSQEAMELVSRQNDKEKIVLLEDGIAGICHKVQVKQGSKRRQIQIKGLLLEGLLENCIVSQAIDLTEDTNPDTLISEITGDLRYTSRSWWSGINFQPQLKDSILPAGFSSGNCLFSKFIRDVCISANIGYKIRIQDTNPVFSLVNYQDRSVNQNTNSHVILSSKIGDLYESEFNFNSQSYKNYICVKGFYTRKDGTKIYTDYLIGYNNSTYISSSVSARVDIVEVEIPQSVSPNNTKDLVNFLKSEGRKVLYDRNLIKSYSCKIQEAGNTFVFGRDYFLGDKVTIMDEEIGLQMDAQLLEYTKTYTQSSGETFEPVFGISQPTLNRILKQKGVI